MIQRVYQQATESAASDVVVATDDQRIHDEVLGFGGKVVMTSGQHTSGTDRIHEAATALGLGASDVVVNVQGDEPLIPPSVINQVAEMISPETAMATLSEAITDAADITNPNVVKVVSDEQGRALYFSRAPVPWDRDSFPLDAIQPAPSGWYRHLGIYAYTVDLLNRFVTWPVSLLEARESLEQLRVLSNGERISIDVCHSIMPPGVDTPDDLPRTIAAIRKETP